MSSSSTRTRIPSEKQYIAASSVAASSAAASRNGLTPSWTSIVEAYHEEGNGDREMLLALLHAKAKEDERLAALDLLKAEQMRAYSTHIAVHGPLFPSPSPYTHTHPHPHPQPRPQPVASTSAITRPHASSTASASTSTSDRSRAPSLSAGSISSRNSSPSLPSEAVTPPTAHGSHLPDEAMLVRMSAGDVMGAVGKRKRVSISQNSEEGEEEEQQQQQQQLGLGSERRKKRQSPIVSSSRKGVSEQEQQSASLTALEQTRSSTSPRLPSIQHLLINNPASSSSPSSASANSKAPTLLQPPFQHAPYHHFQHGTNSAQSMELRPLVSSVRTATSDIRGSA